MLDCCWSDFMKREPNIGLEFQPCAATQMNLQHTKVHYMRIIGSLDNVGKLTPTVFLLYQSRLWNSCLLKSCFRQQVRLLQSKEKWFQRTMSMRFFACSTSLMNSCTYCWLLKRYISLLHFLGYQCLARNSTYVHAPYRLSNIMYQHYLH